MVISVLPVSPPHVRPAIISDNGARGEDDITFKLGDILKAKARSCSAVIVLPPARLPGVALALSRPGDLSPFELPWRPAWARAGGWGGGGAQSNSSLRNQKLNGLAPSVIRDSEMLLQARGAGAAGAGEREGRRLGGERERSARRERRAQGGGMAM